jgi:hypothetical protein
MLPCAADRFDSAASGALGANAFEQYGCGFVGRILGD